MKTETKEQGIVDALHQPNSIEISRNGKGEYSWKIKRYYADNHAVAIDYLKRIDAKLKMELLKHDTK